MQIKFLHAADIHLGYQQYGLEQRYDDFSEAFRWIIDTALEERVDFLLLAGDLFEKRTLDPRTLLIAVTEFERLREARIPVVAIEGNHERTYGDNLSWMEYLNQSGLLHLLDCARRDDGWQPQPWNQAERTGGYVDLAGARIYGLRYQGAQTGTALSEIGSAIAAAPQPAAEFSIFLAHTSVEGYYDQGHPFARQQDLASLRQCVDYLALGHVHAPYPDSLGQEEWFFNPGCPETWSSEEWQYQSKGALFVEVDTEVAPNFKATPRNYPHRRPFMRIRQELDACPTPGALLQLLEEKIRREPLPKAGVESTDSKDASRAVTGRLPQSPKSPVVEIVLTGVARFSRTEIDTAAIEQLAKQYIDPLLVRVRSTLQEAAASVVEDGSALPREVLERTVFENLIRADDRFAASASDVAQIAVLLKQMVLDGVAANEIANEVHSRLRAQGDLSGTGLKNAEPPRNSD
ncbi:MAG: exonuclease SbcCD subunit D [Chloroflexi bacterium]|nr:exonuclease SbcCD subunit D [Chloroflexota bacterium]